MLVDKLLGVKITLPENLDLIVIRLFLDVGHNYLWFISVSFHKTRYTEQQDFVKENRNIKNFPDHQRICPNIFAIAVKSAIDVGTCPKAHHMCSTKARRQWPTLRILPDVSSLSNPTTAIETSQLTSPFPLKYKLRRCF